MEKPGMGAGREIYRGGLLTEKTSRRDAEAQGNMFPKRHHAEARRRRVLYSPKDITQRRGGAGEYVPKRHHAEARRRRGAEFTSVRFSLYKIYYLKTKI